MFRKIVSALTLVVVIIVVWCARDEIFQAVNYLSQTNIWIILLLIPEQLLMYYATGQIFFSYLAARHEAGKVSSWTLARISFELNFVNHTIPSGGVVGLGYMTWRLKHFGASTGQSSFLYLLRYVITICANQLQLIIAIIVLLLLGKVTAESSWVIILSFVLCFSVVAIFGTLIYVASHANRIDSFAKWFSRTANKFVKTITFGKKKNALKYASVKKYLFDIQKDVLIARKNKKILLKPILWGCLYSFLEVASFWIVGISMGHPEILPQLMIAEAIAAVVGAVLLTPGGVGGYEGVMILIMSLFGVEVGLATAVVITTRVIVLVCSIVSGYGFYHQALTTAGKKEREEFTGQLKRKNT